MAEFGDFLVSPEDSLKDIDIECLDFEYVKTCTDAEKLKGIVAILRSGKEGSYPELLAAAEEKLLSVLPEKERIKILRLRKKVTQEEIMEAENDILKWSGDITSLDAKLKKSTTKKSATKIPIRGATNAPSDKAPEINDEIMTSVSTSKDIKSTPKSRQLMIDRRKRREAEYNRLLNNKISRVSSTVNNSGKVTKKNNAENTTVTYQKESSIYSDFEGLESMNEVERVHMSDHEKTKGNECFRAGEYEAAFLCYSRSLILNDMASTTYSNRAIVNLKLGKLELSEEDCDRAYLLEISQCTVEKPSKVLIKILTRRGMTRIRLGKYAEAMEDFASAMESMPTNVGELRQLMKKAADKYVEVEGKEYVLLRDRNNTNKIDIPVRMVVNRNDLFKFSSRIAINHPIPLSEGELLDRVVTEKPPKAPAFTRIPISMSDDEEDEDEEAYAEARRVAPSPKIGEGFSRITISESDSEDEDEEPSASAPGSTRIPISMDSGSEDEDEEAPASAPGSTRIPISMDSGSEDEDEEPPATQEHSAVQGGQSQLKTNADIELAKRNQLEAWKESGNNCMKRKEYTNALEWYNQCLVVDPQYIPALNNRAFVYLEMKEYDKCVADCNTVISLGMHIKAYYRRAVCCEKRALANSARTVELLRKALDDVCVVLTVERENKQAVALKKRVEAMLETIENEISNKREPETESGPVCREGEWEMAVEQCKQKVKVLLEKSKYDEAIVELDSCLSLLDASRNTTNADAINDAHLSTSHMLIQVYKNQMVDASQEKACSSKIIDISTRCIAANNANIKSYLRRGQAYMVVGEYKNAENDFNAILKIDPYNGEVLSLLEELHTKYKLGNSSNADGKTPKKMGNGDCLLATPPPTPDVSVDAKNIQAAGDCLKYKELGNDATRAKDYRLAIEHYTKSIQYDPTHLASYSNRCQAHLKLNMFQDAIEDASVVIDKLQNNSEDRVMLVKVFYRRALAYKGLYEGAMSDMTGSARLQSNTQYNYYLKSGMSDIEQLLKLDPNNKAAKTERAILEKYSIDSAPANVTPTKVESSSNPSGLAERSTKLRTPTGQNAESKSESGSLFSPPVVTTPDKTPPPPKKKASKTKATPTREPISKEVVVPTEAPLTVFEFERVWRVLRSKPDLFIVAYVGKVFKKSTYKKVLKSSLSDELLSYLLKHTYEQCIVLRNGSNDKDSITIAFGILKGLTYAEGLDMLLSLLSADDMKYIQLILDEIDSFCNEHQISPQDINTQKLKLVYRV